MANNNSNVALGIKVNSSAEEARTEIKSLTNDLTNVEKTLNNIDSTLSKINKNTSKVKNNKIDKSYQNASKYAKSTNEYTKNISTNLNKANSGLSKLANTFSKISSITGGLNSVKIIGTNIMSFTAEAMDASETLNLFNRVFNNLQENGETTFSELGKKAMQFQNQLHEAFNTNKVETMEMQAIYQSLGENIGIKDTYAEIMSEGMTQMTYDLASLYNKSASDVSTAIKSGVYAGQTRPMRNFGVDLTQNNLQVTLDQLGIDKAISDLSQAEKEVVRYITTLKQADIAMGDFADTMDSPANQIKILKQQFVELRIAIGNVFVNAFAKILPYVNAIIMVVKNLIETISSLFGIQLKDYGTGASQDYADYLEYIGNSADGASKKVKELKRQTLGFDQINNITSPSKDSSGSGSGSGALGAIDQRLLDAITSYDNGMSKVNNKAGEIRDKIMEWLGFTKQVNAETGEITWKYSSLYGSVEDIAKKLGGKLANELNNMTEEIKWEEIGQQIADGLDTAFIFVNTFVEKYNWENLGKGISSSMNNFLKNIDAKEAGKILTDKVKIAIELLYGAVNEFDWKQFGYKLGLYISGALENIDLKQLASVANRIARGLFDALVSAVKSIEWKSIFKNIISGFNELNGPLKILVSIGAFKAINDLGTSIINLSKAFSNSKIFTLVSNLVTPFKELGGYLVNCFKGFNDVGNKIEKTVGSWSVLQTNAEKLRNTLTGSVGVVIGLTSTYSALKDIGENGAGASTVLESVGGSLSTIMSAGMIGATYGGLPGMLIGSGIGAFAELVSGIWGYLKGTSDKTDDVREANKKLLDSYNDLVKEANTTMGGTDVRIEYSKKLVTELDKYIDENGKVKKSDEDRVNYILHYLNDALGTNYKLVGDQIEQNGKVIKGQQDLQTEIKKQIELKKQEIILNSYQDVYTEALKKQVEWGKKKQEYMTMINILSGKYQDCIDKETDKIKTGKEVEAKRLEAQINGYRTNLSEAEHYYKEYTGKIENYENLYSDSLSGNYDKTSIYISNLSKEVAEYVDTTTQNAISTSQNYINSFNKTNTIKFKGDTSYLDSQLTKYQPGQKTVKINADTSNLNGQVNNAFANKTYTAKVSFSSVSPNKINVVKEGNMERIVFKANGGLFSNGSWKDIAQYANGGLPSVGQMFVAREAGPELVGKIGNNTAVMNNNQIVSSVASGVAQAVASVMGSGQDTVELYVHTDEGTVIDRINRRKRQTGVCPIEI